MKKYTTPIVEPNAPCCGGEQEVYLAADVDARIARLRGALGRSECPYPIGDDRSTDMCIRAGKCGCENRELMEIAS